MTRLLRCNVLALVAGVGVVGLLLGGCPWQLPGGPSGSEGAAKLIPFESADDLLGYFREQASNRYRARSGSPFNWLVPAAAGGAAEDALQAGGDESASEGGFSTTNLQEAGVDESDVFKSDGTNFYIAKERTVRIVRANPVDELAEVGEIELDVYVEALYLLDSTVIALGTQWGPLYGADGPELMMWPPYYLGSDVFVYQIDVSDPTQPAIVGQLELDGTLVSSRLTNERLIVVLTIRPDLPESPSAATIGEMTLDEVLPKMRRAGGGGDEEDEQVPWNRWLRPAAPDGYNMTAVVTLDASDVETVVDSVAVLANAGTIYASTEALYITDAEYDPSEDLREQTAIHKFAFGEDGAARYVASGKVPGRLHSQFSLGEHEGYLRVATHVNAGFRWWDDVVFADGVGVGVAVADSGQDAPVSSAGDELTQDVDPPYNAVYVLNEDGAALEVVGTVTGIAPNEQIYAARFMGDHGFLVTFERIDPLFVLDLSDPQDPHVMGELEIPGFSDYLHPLGEHHLVGVGRSTAELPWGGTVPSALQLSLFDVSDWTNPTLVEQISVGDYGSYSEVSHTHKAFTLFEHGGETMIALPGVLTDIDEGEYFDYDAWSFTGVLCYTVDASEGFTELGRLGSVEHEHTRWPAWQRAAFIGDVLYAVTPAGVAAVPLDDFSSPETVTLAE